MSVKGPLDQIDKSLLNLLADGRFHSGNQVAKMLGISRAAVWKHIGRLEALGLEIFAVPGKGYKLAFPLCLLSKQSIRAGLTAQAGTLLAGIDLHDVIDSTNTHLMGRAHAGANNGTVCLAEWQLAGKGRVGRSWVSPFGSNIYLSLLWRFDSLSLISGLSLAVGVAVARALESFHLPSKLGLKWPNDLLIDGAKLGGILVEVAGEIHGQYAVVLGIGLNCRLESRDALDIDQPWTDLQRAGMSLDVNRNRLIAALLNELLPLLNDYPISGLDAFLSDWRQRHAYEGSLATIQIGDATLEGRIVDISPQGLLIMEFENGVQKTFASGEVRLRVKSS